MQNDRADVVVVGAGAAGLTAACELAASGISTVVLEARERIGGRIFTCRDPSIPVALELGAEFVHGKPPEIFSIAEEAGLLLCDTTSRHWYLHENTMTRSSGFWSKLEALMGELKEDGQEDRSFKDFLDSLPDDKETAEAKAIATRYVQGFHAAPIERIGVQGLARANEAAQRIEDDKQFRILNGYDRLVGWLGQKAIEKGATIHLNSVVEKVYWAPGSVHVTCARDRTRVKFQASRALITVPLGVLQAPPTERGALTFVPQLPAEKKQAINCLAMGSVFHITFRFRNPFWSSLEVPGAKGEKFSELGFIHTSNTTFPTWWTLLPVRCPIIVGWMGGPSAEGLANSDDETIVQQAISSLATILNVSEKQVRDSLHAYYVHNWDNDPFTRGGYTYVPVNGLKAQESLCESVDKTLFFAGEATSIEGYVGTVNGAMGSGRRAAREIKQICANR